MLKRSLAEMPERVRRVERETRAKRLCYSSCLAHEAGDFVSSLKFSFKHSHDVAATLGGHQHLDYHGGNARLIS